MASDRYARGNPEDSSNENKPPASGGVGSGIAKVGGEGASSATPTIDAAYRENRADNTIPSESGGMDSRPGRLSRALNIRRYGISASMGDLPEEEEPVAQVLRWSPPWLVSMIFHMVLLIILGLWVLHTSRPTRLELNVTMSDRLGEQLDELVTASDDEQLLEEEQVISPAEMPEVQDPLAALPELFLNPDSLGLSVSVDAPTIGLALTGRETGRRMELLEAFGGDAVTEAAVERGLQWLKRNKLHGGGWSLVGPYSDGANEENIAAATAMALLAFQGAGNTHEQGKYQKEVASGARTLVRLQEEDGSFFGEGVFVHRMYTNAQCAIALCELYGMSKDSQFRDPAQRGIDYLVKYQAKEGGWKYQPGRNSDLSVTGWVVMALQSARMAQLEVPRETLYRVEEFLDSVQTDRGSRYLYMPGSHGGKAMTAEGLLCRQYLGWGRDDERLEQGIRYLLRNPIKMNSRNVYYWYYATQVLHHYGGDAWWEWNEVMKKVIPETQVKSKFRNKADTQSKSETRKKRATVEARKQRPNVEVRRSRESVRRRNEGGSWDPLRPAPDEWGRIGGRLYTTCLSLYMLEVYYRHLPIYSQP